VVLVNERRRCVYPRVLNDEITAAEPIAAVFARYRIRDLAIEEPEIEGIVRRLYCDSGQHQHDGHDDRRACGRLAQGGPIERRERTAYGAQLGKMRRHLQSVSAPTRA
jgi:hypothetical protein